MHTGARGGYPARSPARAPIDSCPYLAGPRAPQGFPMRQENDIRVNSRVAISPPFLPQLHSQLRSPTPPPVVPPPLLPVSPPPLHVQPALGWRLCGFESGRTMGANRPSLLGLFGGRGSGKGRGNGTPWRARGGKRVEQGVGGGGGGRGLCESKLGHLSLKVHSRGSGRDGRGRIKYSHGRFLTRKRELRGLKKKQQQQPTRFSEG